MCAGAIAGETKHIGSYCVDCHFQVDEDLGLWDSGQVLSVVVGMEFPLVGVAGILRTGGVEWFLLSG